MRSINSCRLTTPTRSRRKTCRKPTRICWIRSGKASWASRQEDYGWFAGVLTQLGQEKGIKLFKDIVAANDISVRKGHTLLGQMVASGEVPLALTLYSYNPDQMKDKGAPVEGFVIGQPVALFQSIAVMKKSPHPHRRSRTAGTPAACRSLPGLAFSQSATAFSAES